MSTGCRIVHAPKGQHQRSEGMKTRRGHEDMPRRMKTRQDDNNSPCRAALSIVQSAFESPAQDIAFAACRLQVEDQVLHVDPQLRQRLLDCQHQVAPPRRVIQHAIQYGHHVGLDLGRSRFQPLPESDEVLAQSL